VAVVGRDADVVLQEGELRRAARTVPAIPDTRAGAAYRRSQQTLLAGRRPALFTRAERCAHLLFRPRTMCMLSGWCEKKSAMRQFSWMWFLGLGLSACTMSGNLMPSRTKNTCRARGAAQALRGRHDRRGRGCSPSGSGPASRRARPLRARQGRTCRRAEPHTHPSLCRTTDHLHTRVLLQALAPGLLARWGRATRTGKLLPTKSLRSTTGSDGQPTVSFSS